MVMKTESWRQDTLLLHPYKQVSWRQMKTISELIYLKLLNNLVEMLPEIFDEIVSFSSICSLTTYVRTSRTTCVF